MRSVPLMFLALVFLGLLIAPAIPAQAQLLEEEDAAWDAFLATLPPSTGEAPITEAVTPVKAASVGIPTMSGAQRRIGVMTVALCALMALLLIPQTRRRLLGRLRGAPAAAPDGVSIHVGASKNVGPGQRIVTLEVDGQRLLVGMSPGRMDLLHSWFEVPYVDPPEERPPPRLAAVATIRDDRSPAGAGPSGGDGAARAAAVSVLDSVLRERAQTAGADVGRLVETWRRSDLRPQESESVESVGQIHAIRGGHDDEGGQGDVEPADVGREVLEEGNREFRVESRARVNGDRDPEGHQDLPEELRPCRNSVATALGYFVIVVDEAEDSVAHC